MLSYNQGSAAAGREGWAEAELLFFKLKALLLWVT